EEVELLHSSIKLYMAQIQQHDLGTEDSRRWAEIIDTAMNLQQSSAIIARMSAEVVSKGLNHHLFLSEEGRRELQTLLERLQSNLNLAMSVFVSGNMEHARKLRRAKHRFRLLNQRYSFAHVERLHLHNIRSIETSSLHTSLLGDMKRLNSLF
ncbi:Na/Pi cotransporter family protein, partial [Escherichia coli]|nr:Na/Pi cotransporter family protein [Escherichia coli]